MMLILYNFFWGIQRTAGLDTNILNEFNPVGEIIRIAAVGEARQQ